MSDSLMDDSVFDDGASSDFAPPAKPAKAAKVAKAKPAAAPKKAAGPAKPRGRPPGATAKPKAKAVPKKKRPDSDDENSDIDMADAPRDDEDDSLLADTPPKQKKAPAPKKSSGKPLADIANESFGMDGAEDVPISKPKKGGASDKYQMLTHLEHIMKRPDTYIGSVERQTDKMWVYNSSTESMEFRDVTYVPGLYKIFDEILVNAADNKQNDKNMSEIRVTLDRETGEISIKNDGKGIPIEIHKEHGIYVPEMIFGHLLTSSNYDDNQQKVTGGRNGYGAKLCNVFSTEFTVETVDSKQKKKYKQTWTDNMSKMGKAKIVDFKSSDDYTKVSWKADYDRFGMTGIDDDFEAMVKRRTYDIAGTLRGVKVYLNGDRVKVTSFAKYMEMYTKSIAREQGRSEDDKEANVIITDKHDRWDIGFAVSDGAFNQVSFVNSIATTSGGTHVNYIAEQIVDRLLAIVNKKNKAAVKLKPAQIKNHIFLFVNCSIVNPAFTSQTKEQLTTKSSQFGSKPVLSDKFLKAIEKTDVIQNIMHFAQQKADQMMKKTDGNKRNRISNAKLTDANKAGTKDGHLCTLILTEGESASVLALAGRAVVNQDLFGVFPLRGKLLNVRDATVDQIMKNAEIQNIKKFMGLQHKKEYTVSDMKSLRYGHLMIMTDQDHDGSHIKGLLINFLQCQFPSLLKIPGFLLEFITPIVKVWKGDPKNPRSLKSFFSMPEYEEWKEQHKHEKGWEHKYFKGLGTSDIPDAQIYFKDLDTHMKSFQVMREEEEKLIELAFSKKKADARKEWLRDFVPGQHLDLTTQEISYDDFVNKELILFSMADNLRSIPSVIDGLKPGQRKVMYTCFRRNIKKDVKVIDLAGSVSGTTDYAHGESSMQGTIVGLAQNFVGTNNINYLEPSGNFGSRLKGGADAASARYIYTRLSPFARRIFHAHDDALLKYGESDGKPIEPEMYIPVLPTILINGSSGIGTGWSSEIPNFNPMEIIDNIRIRMKEGATKEDMRPMVPWYKGFTGRTEELGENRYQFTGTIRQTGDNEVEVTELPVRYWTQDFKEKLEEIIKADKTPSFIKDYIDYNTPDRVHFIIKMEDKYMAAALAKGLEEMFKLFKPQSTTNLVAFDAHGRIHKYATVLDIIEEFYHVRLRYYEKRKQHQLEVMHKELSKMTNQAKFIQMIIDGKLVVSKKKKLALVQELKKLGFTPIPKVDDAKKAGEIDDVQEDEEDTDETEAGASASDYDYLLGMAIWSLTQERVEKLLKQIGEKEEEIDTLIKLSPKDIWNVDLDAFVEEWNTQLEQENKRKKKVASITRRASQKLGLAKGKGKKKRRMDGSDSDDSDDDFGPVKKKAKPKKEGLLSYLQQSTRPVAKKPSALDALKASSALGGPQKQGTLLSHLAKKEATPQTDGASDDRPGTSDSATAPKRGRPTAAKPAKKPLKVIESDDDDDDTDVFAAVAKEATTKPRTITNSRTARPAAKAVSKYNAGDDSDSDEDDMLGDVSLMVKGIGGSSNGAPMFKTSNATLPVNGTAQASKAKKASPADLSDDDTTNYEGLAQSSPQRPPPRNINDTINSDDSDDFSVAPKKTLASKPAPKLKAPVSKAAPKTKPAPTVAPVKKPSVLSPAAKAYARKILENGRAPPAKPAAPKPKAKKPVPVDSDDDMEDADAIADSILSDDDQEPTPKARAPAVRPGRRAAAAKPARYVVSDDEEEDGDEASEASFGDSE
ncbi:DNA topoisomerase 2 [Plenodomus lingam]|uniref:DNA topoisomerase 2 n=1 Tax=Leptosphaeria maculans (strain JN3 / isolate v23.1.3 / race Av1-4-5-6-7-8) TaxID=985895 RepID=E4ZSM3_LEPMJ|nr:similar to DNA topoisomerase II [Plenodomus lingam JN3]KAH9862471.1 DNA topoisomerase 2 [Plenodomus lingam]CBX94403.1 similar to DNA topoisomerase II [Plenodomus lingam JN3]